MADSESTTEASADDAAAKESNEGDVPEPHEATHGAEDETWSTDGHDTPHLEERVTELESEVRRLETELSQEQDRHLRARADYQNLQRRTEDERAAWPARAAARVIERFLEPVDILARAADDLEAVDAERARGVRMAHDQIWSAMEREGLEAVPGVGSPFDAHVHEAIAHEPAEHPEGTVSEVIRPGYRIQGKLLRAALVKVSAGPADA